tara:strand:- start:321 stop:617 length:297 start_codon:yes stop_codon:yes gene_type:complete
MNENLQTLEKLIVAIKNKKNSDPNYSYTAKLFEEGKVKIANKLGEEAVETISAFLSQKKDDICQETADLIYHLLVLLEYAEINFEEITQILENRMIKG